MKFLDNAKVIQTFKFRHACKEFDANKAVSKDDFTTILEAARLSPSSFGFEPWKFVVLRDKTLRKKIYDVTWGGQDALDNASEFVLILARTNKHLHPDSQYLNTMMKEVKGLDDESSKMRREFFTAFQKEHFCIYNDEQKVFDWACKQCYIALSNMLTTAALLGVDSLPIEGFNRKSVNEILEKEGIINTEDFSVAVMAAFGYEKNAPKYPSTRQKFEEVVQFV